MTGGVSGVSDKDEQCSKTMVIDDFMSGDIYYPIYIFVYVYIYIHTYIHTDRQTDIHIYIYLYMNVDYIYIYWLIVTVDHYRHSNTWPGNPFEHIKPTSNSDGFWHFGCWLRWLRSWGVCVERLGWPVPRAAEGPQRGSPFGRLLGRLSTEAQGFTCKIQAISQEIWGFPMDFHSLGGTPIAGW